EALALLARAELEWGRDLHAVIARAREGAALAAELELSDVRASCLGTQARAFAVKHVKSRALGELANAGPALAAHPEILRARADVLVAFDERAEATRVFEQLSTVPGGERAGAVGRARMARLLGDFAAARALLDSLGEVGPGELPPRHERLRLALSE